MKDSDETAIGIIACIIIWIPFLAAPLLAKTRVGILLLIVAVIFCSLIGGFILGKISDHHIR